MKSILISIQPRWCELIDIGKKTIEVRKTRPKLETPFKVYIYETKGKNETPWMDEDGHLDFRGRGQVIGEFVCDEIFPLWDGYAGTSGDDCLSFDEREGYLSGKMGYGWHISDLVIYDKPKELSEFFYACKKPIGTDCSVCIDHRENTCKPITRPPQSWCYVEEVQDNG